MVCSEILKARVSPEIKLQAKAFADREALTEAAWLKRLVIREVRAAGEGMADGSAGPRAPAGSHHGRRKDRALGCSVRIYVRLRNDDQLLLKARAAARGMRPATYISVLTRCHLRRLSPLPKDELMMLKRSIGELSAIGRNLNQIARTANEGGRLPGSMREEFRAMLKVCEALRDNTKSLLKANVTSWDSGYVEDV